MERPFVELIDGLDFVRAHALGVYLDDMVSQPELEAWMETHPDEERVSDAKS